MPIGKKLALKVGLFLRFFCFRRLNDNKFLRPQKGSVIRGASEISNIIYGTVILSYRFAKDNTNLIPVSKI